MKKLFVLSVAVCAVAGFAAMASANTIDVSGISSVSINAPAGKISVSSAKVVSLDSNGAFVAAVPATVTATSKAAPETGKITCLDSYCKFSVSL